MSAKRQSITLNFKVSFKKPVTKLRFACIFIPFQLEYETMTVATPLRMESE